MPCDSGPSWEDVDKERRLRDITARLACSYCRQLEAAGETIPLWAEEWWHQQAYDKIRIERERMEAEARADAEKAKSVYASLTTEQQETLRKAGVKL